MKRHDFSAILAHPSVVLAPLAGVSDAAFRQSVRQACALPLLAVSEMVSAKALCYDNQKTKDMLFFYPHESYTGIQLFGSDPETLSEAVKRFLNAHPCAFIDLNFGCPVKKIVRNGEGSALLADTDRLYHIARAVVEASEKPVSAKVRLGVDEDHINLDCTVEALMQAGISLVSVHARTAKQMYSGHCDYAPIAKAKRHVSIPIVVNGDITTPEIAKQVLLQTEADAVMVGRGVMHNPFLPRQICDYLKTGTYEPVPIKALFSAMLTHLNLLVRYKGERLAVLQFRTHFAAYTKGLAFSCEMREKINTLSALQEVYLLLETYASLLNEKNARG